MRRQVLPRVVAMILQHVPSRIRDLPRRSQDNGVVPVDEDLSGSPSARRVHPASDADREPLHTSRKRPGALCFHQQVQVSALNGVVHDAHPEPLSRSV
jgi:hypothetical protein